MEKGAQLGAKRALALALAALLLPLLPGLAAAEEAGPQPPQESLYDNPLISPRPYSPLTEQEAPGLGEYVNILLLGFDAEYKSYAENGGDSHTDAMMVVSVHTPTNAARLITLPRDTLTYVPGIRGIYKLNGAVNAGGGKTQEGLRKAAEAASALLGNVPIDYYFGIDMHRIVEIGDLLGGVDIDVAINFTTDGGKRYSTGRRHLDGEAIYSYMRARHSAEGTDKRRTERQRAVISALLCKMQQENLYLQIPQLLASIQGGYYTNISPAAVFQLLPIAAGVDVENIQLYTVEGTLRTALNNWNIHFIDQEARIRLLKELFGIDAAPMRYGSPGYCQWLVGNGQAGNGAMSALRYLYVASQVEAYAAALEDPTGEIAPARQGAAELCGQLKAAFCLTADRVDRLERSYRTDSQAVELNRHMNALKEQLLAAVTELARLSGFPGSSGKDALGRGDLHWAYRTRWETDPAINEVYVNFH